MYHMQTVITRRGKIKILLDENYKVVLPVKKFLKYLDNKLMSPNTITTYCYHLKLYFEYLEEINIAYDEIFDDKDNGALDYLSNFITYLQYPDYFKKRYHIGGEEPARTASTVNLIITAVLSFYDYLSRNEKLKNIDAYKEYADNGAFRDFFWGMHLNLVKKHTNIFKIKEYDEDIKFITKEQYQQLLEACTCYRDKLICACGFMAGMRVSEILNLRISDLHLWENKIVIIPRENNINGSRVKNYAAGYIFVPDDVVQMFLMYLAEIDNVDTDYVFINLRGKTKYDPMNRSNVESLFERLSEKVGFHVHPHMLRHGFAVSRISAGYELIDLQKDMRHKSLESTMIYAGFYEEAKREKARKYYSQTKQDFTPDSDDYKKWRCTL